MFRWYQQASICFVHLSDVSVIESEVEGYLQTEELSSSHEDVRTSDEVEQRISKSAWFTRGWTLQELIAPDTTRFYDASWRFFGTKLELENILARRTGIEKHFLSGARMETASVAKRMSWASERVTTRVEDMAYCLLGIFGVNMPLLYGEGIRAFTRLQEEIMKESADQSLFAWTAHDIPHRSFSLRGPLAASPKEFINARMVEPYPDLAGNQPYAMTNQGLRIEMPILPDPLQAGLSLAILGCHGGHFERPLAVPIQRAESHIADKSQGTTQYGRFVLSPEPRTVTSQMLAGAELKTIYWKNILLSARSHDKEYTFHVRLLPSRQQNLGSSLSASASFTPQQETPTPLKSSPRQIKGGLDHISQLALATNSLRAGVLFESNTVTEARFLVCLKVIPPETYIHELDRWLRSRCTCKLITHSSLPDDWQEVVTVIESDLVQPEGFDDTDFIYLSHLSLKIKATVRKDLEDSGKVIKVDLQIGEEDTEPYEMEGSNCFPVELEAHSTSRDAISQGASSFTVDLQQYAALANFSAKMPYLRNGIGPPLDGPLWARLFPGVCIPRIRQSQQERWHLGYESSPFQYE